jgi:hypothetical protein
VPHVDGIEGAPEDTDAFALVTLGPFGRLAHAASIRFMNPQHGRHMSGRTLPS